MKSFEYAAPKSLKEATALLGTRWGDTEILAGGTDLVTCLKQQLIAPRRVVSLKNVKDLDEIKEKGGALRIGAMATLGELAGNSSVKKNFPALITAIQGIGSPQLLNAGTVGGELCQRPRCWYFRNGLGLFGRQGEISLVREGENRYHAIFGNSGPALFVHPSSLAPALVALAAEFTITGPDNKTRMVPAAEFFRTPANENERETAMAPNEILTEISVPLRGLRNATYEIRHRHGLDWPYVTASVAFAAKDGTASGARVVLGHVAPTPWIASRADTVLNGARLDETTATRAGEAAATGAAPLSGNAYKVTMVRTAVKRAVLAANA